jgi:hypothetical protein
MLAVTARRYSSASAPGSGFVCWLLLVMKGKHSTKKQYTSSIM